jgi:hypothetical protein
MCSIYLTAEKKPRKTSARILHENCTTSHHLKWGHLPPNEVARIAQNIRFWCWLTLFSNAQYFLLSSYFTACLCKNNFYNYKIWFSCICYKKIRLINGFGLTVIQQNFSLSVEVIRKLTSVLKLINYLLASFE